MSDRPFPAGGRGVVVTVGTFDGVHVGHRAVCDEIVRRAERTGGHSVLVTFHPHPLRVVRPESAPALLTPSTERTLLLAETGLHHALILRFDRELQRYSAARFVEEILLGRLGMTELVMGYDHGFGRDREGSVDTMRELGRRRGFAVDVVDAVRLDGRPVSSTRIREALRRGDVVEAARCLGRPYALEGEVVTGSRRGRQLGFPTANLRVDSADKLLPQDGIYAVQGWVAGERVPGLLHLGPRPVFPGEPPTVEVHLLDWSGDLYGRRLRIELRARLREVRSFETVDALVEQMHRDATEGRAILRALPEGRVVSGGDAG